jgi:hypothetical protein
MNTEEARVKTGVQQSSGYGDERGGKPACDSVRLKYCATSVYRRKRSSRTTVAFRRRRTFSARDLVVDLGPDVEPHLYAALTEKERALISERTKGRPGRGKGLGVSRWASSPSPTPAP